MPKKKYYAIAVGKKPGIYTDWLEAQAQIKGFPRALYKGFATREEAQKWLQAPSTTPRTPRTPSRNKTDLPVQTDNNQNRRIEIYTDGGALGNPGPGGYGVVMLSGTKRKELSGGYRLTTNNRMELVGAIVALKQLKLKDTPIVLYTDSSYVVNGINKGWAKSWRKNNWIKSDKKPALNRDLWAELLNLIEGLDITLKWVKGHAGNPYNERCDELAVATAKQPDLPVDTGYETA
jgi:ribonuclease HI